MRRLIFCVLTAVMGLGLTIQNGYAQGGAGTVRALAIDPSAPTTLYAGVAPDTSVDGTGGLFKSTNGGTNWTIANSGLTSTDVDALAIDPSTPATLYAGTFGGGVFKTTNGGASWTAVNSGLTNIHVQALAIDPSNPATLYAGTFTGGVFKSIDGGTSWTAVNSGLSFTDVRALTIDPSTPSTLYAGGCCAGVFKSTNGGGSWTAANSGIDNMFVLTLAIDPSTSASLYAAGTNGSGVFKSVNGGASWTGVNSGLTNQFIYSLAIDPYIPTTLYAGTAGGVFKSTNSGTSWAAVNSGLTIQSGLNYNRVTALAIDPFSPAILYAGNNGGGVFKSGNGGTSWTAVNVGLTNIYVYSLAIDPSTPSTLYAGTAGGVFKSTNGGASWNGVTSGLTTAVTSLAIDPSTPTTLYAGTNGGNSLSEGAVPGAGVFKSTNGGISWTAVNSGLTGPVARALAIDPSTPSTLYAGTTGAGFDGGGVFKSTNGATSWTAVNNGLGQSLYVYALAIDPATPATLYSGARPFLGGNGVFKSTNGATSWSAIGPTNTLVYSIAVDPFTPATLYAGTCGGIDCPGGGAFKSTNGGTSWIAINSGLPNTYVFSLAIDPLTSATLYAGTYGDAGIQGGVFKSTNGGTSWSAVNSGLTKTDVRSLAIDPSTPATVYAGTNGAGVFKSTNGGASWEPTGIDFTAPMPTPTSVVFSITPTTPASAPSDQDIFVSGANFKPNLSVDISSPGGGVTTLSGEQIQNVTETSFIMRATLNVPGSWSLKVKNPDNQQSTSFPFTVASGGPNPFITSISPSTPTATGANQNVIVTGGNFQNGLRVNATFPNGGIATLQGTGQIQNVTAISFIIRITLNTEGSWKISVINPDSSQSAQFTFNVNASGPPPTGLPTSVLSPVIGPLRVTTSNLGIADSKWEFNQHKTGSHTATGGISLSNDTYAWDANLYTPTNSNADAGKAVFATAAGQVVSYVGTQPGSGPGAVLIAHPNAASPVWFSGYLHMTNVRVTLNQAVDSMTLIGDVGRAGVSTEYLQFVVYSGTNTRGNLRSFNAAITERGTGVITPPVITSIVPSTVNESDTPQLVTINGTDFAADSIIEVRAPNGSAFSITPETIALSANAQILKVTANAITVRVPFFFSGTYEFTVINRSTGARSAVSCPQRCVNVTAVSKRAPVILVPGIMGSKIAKSNGEELFPALPDFLSVHHRQLKDNIVNTYVPIQQRQVVATQVFRSIGYGPLSLDFYGTLIDWLTNEGYTPYVVTSPSQRTLAGCDTNQTDANLFLFAYDWRNSNAISAEDLRDFVGCIAKIRYRDNPIPADFKVDIIAHSMGGLVARRYILDGNHHVGRMVTLGTPWLGAPKSIPVFENGRWDGGVNLLIDPPTLKEIAPFIKGAQELIPSAVYTDHLATVDQGSYPLGENGWRDFDPDPRDIRQYNFDQLRAAMNFRYANQPGNVTNSFHSAGGQDDWRNDTTGVSYYNFFGRSSGTIGSVIAHKNLIGQTSLQTVPTEGDGTVPELSALRTSTRASYLGTVVTKPFLLVNHRQLTSNSLVLSTIRCVLILNNANNCLNLLPTAFAPTPSISAVVEPTYNLTVIGSSSVLISDSFGNTTDPLSTTLDGGIATVPINVTGDNYVNAVFPLDQNYQVILKAPANPLSIKMTKSDGQTISQAIRYVDIILPPNVSALLEITPQSVSILKYDSDGNGTFDTQVNPTINVTGTPAQDIEPPQLHINETVQSGNSRIDLEATDVGTGVQKIMYSLNGTTFQQYSNPLTLNVATTPTIYAFADDNVFNRSGLVTHDLTASNVGFSVTGPSSAPAGGSAAASWNSPAGRPVDDWIGLFTIGMLNSVYLSKQYTGGSSTGNLSFTIPNQDGTYEFRYLLNDGFSSVAASGPITVGTTAPPLQLLLEASGPASDQAAVLHSLLFLRDPLPVVNGTDFLNLGVDRNTRVIVFVMNLQLAQGETSSSVVVTLTDSNNQSYDVPAEDVRLAPNFNFTQVIFRLPDNLPAGTCTILIKAHGQVSNLGTIRIRI